MAYFTNSQGYLFLCSDIPFEEKQKLDDYLQLLEPSPSSSKALTSLAIFNNYFEILFIIKNLPFLFQGDYRKTLKISLCLVHSQQKNPLPILCRIHIFVNISQAIGNLRQEKSLNFRQVKIFIYGKYAQAYSSPITKCGDAVFCFTGPVNTFPDKENLVIAFGQSPGNKKIRIPAYF